MTVVKIINNNNKDCVNLKQKNQQTNIGQRKYHKQIVDISFVFDCQNLRVVTFYYSPMMIIMAEMMPIQSLMMIVTLMMMILTLMMRLLTLMMVLKSKMNVKTSGMMTVSERPFEFTANISSLNFYW